MGAVRASPPQRRAVEAANRQKNPQVIIFFPIMGYFIILFEICAQYFVKKQEFIKKIKKGFTQSIKRGIIIGNCDLNNLRLILNLEETRLWEL
jgi:hypothetical protein